MSAISRNKVSVYAYGAFIPESDGSHARVCSLLDRLNDTISDIAVYSYDNHPDFPWKPANVQAFRARWPHVELVLESYTAKLKMLTRLKNLLISVFPDAADRLLQLSVRGWSPGFTKLMDESLAVFVNYTHGLNQLNGVEPKRCLVDTHDVNFAKWAKITDSSSVSTTALRKLRGEIAALQTDRRRHSDIAIRSGVFSDDAQRKQGLLRFDLDCAADRRCRCGPRHAGY